MAKKRIIRTVIVILLTLLIVFSAAFYVYDIVINESSPTENLFPALAAIFICAGSLVRILAKRGRRPLKFYESFYSKDIYGAFENSYFNRQKLLCAIRLYNEDNFGKALKYLSQLKPACKTREDLYAVGIFTALVFTDMGYSNDAIVIYNALINMNITSSTIYGNLGSIYSGLGRHDDAIAALRLAIQNDEKNPAPYHNLAKLYFDTYDFENAKKYALKALEVNHKFRQSSSMLAVIYSLENDKENAEKYKHIALTSGETPERLHKAILHYKAKVDEDLDREDEEGDIFDDQLTQET